MRHITQVTRTRNDCKLKTRSYLSLQREFHTKTSKRQSCDVPSDLKRRPERYCTRNNRRLHFSRHTSVSLPLLSFVLIPVSEKERVWPRDPRPGPFWPSEKDERLWGGRILAPCCWGCSRGSLWSLLWVELRETRRLPRLPMARYSGPSS